MNLSCVEEARPSYSSRTTLAAADLTGNSMAQIHDVPGHYLTRAARVWNNVQTDAVAKMQTATIFHIVDVDKNTLVGLVNFAKTEAPGAVGGNMCNHKITRKVNLSWYRTATGTRVAVYCSNLIIDDRPRLLRAKPVIQGNSCLLRCGSGFLGMPFVLAQDQDPQQRGQIQPLFASYDGELFADARCDVKINQFGLFHKIILKPFHDRNMLTSL